jgi:hypothetical protein
LNPKAFEGEKTVTWAQKKALLRWQDGSGTPRHKRVNVRVCRALLDMGLLAQQGASFSRDCVLFLTDAGQKAAPTISPPQ